MNVLGVPGKQYENASTYAYTLHMITLSSNMACVVPSDSSGLQVGFLTGISSYPADQRLSHLQRNARVMQH
ncbi:hypothetical protein U9M48_006276 [Paspalum notatum var. saurae]|uniref:Uncharacterized protein n=1 Tax=Paspalum notatum var. saurae TaxID=547442 RepID=A0AAQ3PRV5_PASNO